MKRFIYAALSAMLLVCVLAVSVCAAQDPSASLVPKDETAASGENVEIAVMLNSEATSTVGLVPSWDKNLLEWTGANWETVSGIMMPNHNLSLGTASCAFSPASNVAGNLLTLTFKVKDGVELGDTEIGVRVLVKSNGVQKELNVSAEIEIVCRHSFVEVQKDEYKKNNADCTAPLTYFKSCEKCGEKGTETFAVGEKLAHTFDKKVEADTYKKNDASCTEKLTYYYSCECGEKGTTTFEVGQILSHTFDKKVEKAEYKKNEASCTEKLTYYYSCECGEKGAETFEVGDYSHSFTVMIQDDKYKKNNASCTEKLTYYFSCVCGEKGTATFEVGDYAHSFTEKVQKAEYKKNDASCTQKLTYYYSCKCGAKSTQTFEVGNALGHKFGTVWVTNEKGHWHQCSVCNYIQDEATHTPGPEATENTPQTCTVCAFVLKEKLSHVHDFGKAWVSDGDNHWHQCKCGEKSGIAAHNWNDGEVTVAPTVNSEGEITYTCTDCGEKKTAKIQKLPPDATNNNEDPAFTDIPDIKDQDKSVDPLILVIIIGLVLVVFASVALIILKKKKN